MIFISTSFFNKNITKSLKELKNTKIRNLELSFCKYEKNLVKKILNENYFNFSIHNYFPRPKKDFVFNLCSEKKSTKNKSIKMARNGILLSSKLGQKYYSIHAGYLFDPEIISLGKKFTKQKLLSRDKGRNVFIKEVKKLSSFAKKLNVKLLIENNVLTQKNYKTFEQNPFLMVDDKEIVLIMKKLRNNVGLLLDVAHLNVSAKTLKFSKKKFWQSCERWIEGYHLSENNGLSDTNDLIKEKSWFWKFVKKDINYITLEVKFKNYVQLTKQFNLVKRKLNYAK